MILTHGVNSLRYEAPEPIPVSGLVLVNQFDFKKDSSLVDNVGKVTASIANPNSPLFVNDGVDISYTGGCDLNVKNCIGDYLEAIFHLENYNGDGYHIRCINASSGLFIGDMAAYVIWRGNYSNWNTYWSSWQSSYSSDYGLFNGKKLGIHLKTDTKFDIYVDDMLIASDRSYTRNYLVYGIGVNTDNYTSRTKLVCERVRIFRKYKEVKIGGRKYYSVVMPDGKEWMAENLDYKFSGCGIGGTGTPSTPNAWYYNNDESTYGIDSLNKYGLLYNWPAVKYLEDNKSTLIPGWHVPTYSEWNDLITSLGGINYAGTYININGQNPYGFTGRKAGEYSAYGFQYADNYGNFWTSSEEDATDANYLYITGVSDLSFKSKSKLNAYSVRLVKDS